MGATCDRAFHEQLRRRELPNSRRSQSWALRRIRKRVQPVHTLTLDPKRLAARCDDMDLPCGLDDAWRQCGDRLNEMLAGFENQKNAPVAQIGDQARYRVVRLNRQPQHGGDSRCCEFWIA